jgi:PAS domain S-box-containing protein
MNILSEVQAFKHVILDSVTDAIVVINGAGLIVMANAAWRKLMLDNALELGILTPRIDIGSNYLDACQFGKHDCISHSPDSRDGIEAVLSGQLPAFSTEYACHTPNQQRWFSMKVTPLIDGSSGAVIVLTDVTARQKMNNALGLAAIAFNTCAGVVVTDAHGIILRVNEAFKHITGYSEEKVINQSVAMLKSGHHDATFYQAIWDAIRCHHFWQGEILDMRKNGDIFPVWMAITAVVGQDGFITHYVGSFHDITLQKKKEKLLQDASKVIENQTKKSAVDIHTLKDEAVEINTALKVMLRLRQTENLDAKNNLVAELQQEVMPFLNRLKGSSREPKDVRLLNTLEANLQRLILAYGGVNGITSTYRVLTPKEIQVASMVREGFSSKVIASTLSICPDTINIHRKNIRRKLGLKRGTDNLRSYLLSMIE